MLPARPKASSSLANCLPPWMPRVDISLDIKDHKKPYLVRVWKGQEMRPVSCVSDPNLGLLMSVLSQAPETL